MVGRGAGVATDGTANPGSGVRFSPSPSEWRRLYEEALEALGEAQRLIREVRELHENPLPKGFEGSA